MGIYTEEQLREINERQFLGMTDEEYSSTVYTLYDVMRDYLNHSRVCETCGERMWVSYCDGHVADQCLPCNERRKDWTLEQMLAADIIDMPGYITDYPVPREPVPDWMEVRRFDPLRFDDGSEFDGYEVFDSGPHKGQGPHYKPHEQYYRMKVKTGVVTSVDGDKARIDDKIDAIIGTTEVKREYVKHDIRVGDVVEYNPFQRIARKTQRN